MKAKRVRSIGFDGLHRCGKGTQLQLLRDYLWEKGIKSVIVRGDGTRRGLGLVSEDPYSTWWQEHYESFFRENRTPEENRYLSDLVYFKLMKEANYAMYNLERDSVKGALLMDRTFVSRWFVKRQQETYISLENAVSVVDPDTHKTISPLIPERTYVIYVQVDELLKRVESSTDSPEKKQFRLDNLTKYFNDFERLIEELPETFYGSEIRIIEGNDSPEKIHGKILKYEGI